MEFLTEFVLKRPNLKLIFDRRIFFLTQDFHWEKIQELRDRSIFLYSGGKLFNCEDWGIVWTISSKEITNYIQVYYQWCFYCSSTPTLYGVLEFLKSMDQAQQKEYLNSLPPKYLRNYEQMKTELAGLGGGKILGSSIPYCLLV